MLDHAETGSKRKVREEKRKKPDTKTRKKWKKHAPVRKKNWEAGDCGRGWGVADCGRGWHDRKLDASINCGERVWRVLIANQM